jgi:hypothetical protein
MANTSIVENIIKWRRQEEAAGSDEGYTLYYEHINLLYFHYFAYSTESLTNSMTTIGCVTAKKLKYVGEICCAHILFHII